MNARFCAFVACLTLLSPGLFADDDHHHGATEKLGAVNFPTSCATVVQKPFERGVALLHSFEYEQAENQFKEISAKDPQCAIAYWGEAMSLYHQLWQRPAKDVLQHGHELVEKGRALQPKTARERDYLDALAAFYNEPGKLGHEERAAAYAQAMEGAYQRNPQDREAAVFYALALLSSGNEEDPTLANAKKAVGILQKQFDLQPDHPGIAHYIIHSCDNPAMAGLGLAAARKYASIAPSSAHAVHMPSHIFARLGLWQDDIQSNTLAIQAADKMSAMHFHTMHHRMHSLDFMHYAYMQIGDDEKARATMDQLAHISKKDIEDDYQNYYDERSADFAARYATERRQWKEALTLQPVSGALPHIQATTYWAQAVAAGHLLDAAAAQAALDKYDAAVDATRKGPKPHLATRMKNGRDEAQAWAFYAQERKDKKDEALKLMRAVADRQDKIGKGETEMPAREMLADMMLAMGKPQEALGEYETSLRTDPNRFNGLFGAAQAAEQAQQKQKAARYYAQLLANCQGAQSDRPELEKAKTLVAAK
ncbi:MAG TPA: hypothetical protein VNW97_07945 [Candidatus Saccharimonadales bacterium]|jgi:hypothetical protein|nr:hypothetical protein [Candidatus Saccharimonadales bacterium]